MTYQGERARPTADGGGRAFEISKIRFGGDGQVRDVLWCEVLARSDRAAGAPVVVPVADVVDAIHDGAQVAAVFSRSVAPSPERRFVVVLHANGRESIALDGPRSPGRDLIDMVRLND